MPLGWWWVVVGRRGIHLRCSRWRDGRAPGDDAAGVDDVATTRRGWVSVLEVVRIVIRGSSRRSTSIGTSLVRVYELPLMHGISIVFVVCMWLLLRVDAILAATSLARLKNLLLCYTTTTSTSRAIVLTIVIIGLRLIGGSIILLTTPSPTSLMLVPAITLFGRAGLDLALLTVNDDMSSLSRDGCKEPKSIRLKQQSRDTNNVSCHGYIYIYI